MSVTLRPLAETDVDHVMTWVNDPAVVGNFGWFTGKPITREAELGYLGKLVAQHRDPNGAERVYSVLDSSGPDGRYLGQVGLHQIHRPSRVGRLSIIIAAKADHGKGYGTAAMRALVAEAFDTEKLHKVWMMFYRTNQRTRALANKLGFIDEGVLREEYLYQGAYHDMVRTALLEREYRAQPQHDRA